MVELVEGEAGRERAIARRLSPDLDLQLSFKSCRRRMNAEVRKN